MTNSDVKIRAMADHEMVVWGALRTKLWPDCREAENELEYKAFQDGSSAVKIVFLAFEDKTAIGFAEISERNVVDGCGIGPAAYLEGWFVAPDYQGQRIGRLLIEASRDWARQQGYAFLASDVEPHNVVSQKAHEKLGFIETGRSINYHMPL